MKSYDRLYEMLNSSRITTLKVSRRSFIGGTVSLIAASAAPAFVLSAIPLRAFALQSQGNWRFCNKCHALFFDGTPNKGRCTAGGGHVSAGHNFHMLIGDVGEEVPPGQIDWRLCNKCYSMIYAGYSRTKGLKGLCPAGGGHVSGGELYALEHDRAASAEEQRDWRFCNKCFALFFDGYPNKGRCPTGNGHVSQGYNFVLRWRGNGESIQRID